MALCVCFVCVPYLSLGRGDVGGRGAVTDQEGVRGARQRDHRVDHRLHTQRETRKEILTYLRDINPFGLRDYTAGGVWPPHCPLHCSKVR